MPYELRPYAWSLVKYINRHFPCGTICEIGCGLGDIIRNVNGEGKWGCDISPEAISCAKFLSKKDNTKFFVGTFANISEVDCKTLDLLITVNFIHQIPSEILKTEYNKCFEYVDIKNIIVDVVYREDRYSHDFDDILEDYELCSVIWKSHERQVLHYKKKSVI